MTSVKKITLAALVALALAAGGLAVGGEVAGSNPKSFGRESASLPTQAEELQQVAGSRGSSSTFGRESS